MDTIKYSVKSVNLCSLYSLAEQLSPNGVQLVALGKITLIDCLSLVIHFHFHLLFPWCIPFAFQVFQVAVPIFIMEGFRWLVPIKNAAA